MESPPVGFMYKYSEPDIHEPFTFLTSKAPFKTCKPFMVGNFSGKRALLRFYTCESARRFPRIRGPGSGGVMMTTASATKPMTAPMTKSAMAIPFQFRWLGVAATNSYEGKREL